MPAALGAQIGTIAQLSSRHNARIRTVHFACLGRSDFPEHVVSGGTSGLMRISESMVTYTCTLWHVFDDGTPCYHRCSLSASCTHEQCQKSQSLMRNRLAKTVPSLKTPAECGFTPGMLSERETRYLRNQNEFWHHLWCLGDLRRRNRRWCRVYRRPPASQQRPLHEPCKS